LSVIVEGNKKLEPTATTAEKNVPSRYSIITDFIFVFCPLLWFDMEDIIRKKTRIGAAAFNADRKILPKTPNETDISGKKMPAIIPNNNPIDICRIRFP